MIDQHACLVATIMTGITSDSSYTWFVQWKKSHKVWGELGLKSGSIWLIVTTRSCFVAAVKSFGFCKPSSLEKEVATHSSILAWRIPWTEEPGSYSPWGHKELDMTERLSNNNKPSSYWYFIVSMEGNKAYRALKGRPTTSLPITFSSLLSLFSGGSIYF